MLVSHWRLVEDAPLRRVQGDPIGNTVIQTDLVPYVGPSEDRAFWTAFLRIVIKRGLWGVRLVTSDAP
jgi:hypothetical protein